MSKNQFWQESLHRNLTTAHGFFQPRGWSQDHNKIWLNALNGWSAEQIDYAFKEYYAVGKHMPKPSEIIEILRNLFPRKAPEQRHADDEAAREKEPWRMPDPKVSAAWMIYQTYYLRTAKYSINRDALPESAVLDIVNRHAAKTGQFGSVHPAHRIDAIWGNQVDLHSQWWEKNAPGFLLEGRTGVFVSVRELLRPKPKHEQLRELAERQQGLAA